jgi:hypothetical protein
MKKISLSLSVGKLRQKGRISFGDVQRLRRDILPDGIGAREEAELLLELDRHVSRADDAWSNFLTATLVEFVVWSERPTGIVDEDTARWLAATLSVDGAAPVTKAARRIAREVAEEAHAFENGALTALAAGFAKRKARANGPALPTASLVPGNGA